jgi:hypothetical protein
MMQTAGYFPSVPSPLPASPQHTSTESLRASVAHLLSKAHNLPCSKVAQAFSQLVQPTSRFQLALDALLPILDDHVEVRHPHSACAFVFISHKGLRTHLGLLHLVFPIRPPSNHHQSVRVGFVCYIRERDRSGSELGERRKCSRERSVRVCLVEDLER